MSMPVITVDPTTAGVSVSDADPSLSVLWDIAIQSAVIGDNSGPTIASRAYAVLHTAIYEAWAAYDPVAVGTAFGDTKQQADALISDANKATAMSYAAYVAAMNLFPDQQTIFDTLMAELGHPTDLSPLTDAAALGVELGQGVVLSFADDGSNQANGYVDTTGYEPVNASPEDQVSIEHWTPEHVPIDSDGGLQNFLTPHWGWVDPFAEANSDLTPPPPQPFFVDGVDATLDMTAQTVILHGLGEDIHWRDFRSLVKDLRQLTRGTEDWQDTRAFIRDLRMEFWRNEDVRDPLTLDVDRSLIGPIINEGFIEQAETLIEASANLTVEEKVIAEFMEDGAGTAFPPGTWMTFGHYVSARDDHTLDQDAQMFFALSNAVFDAGTATWRAKVEYDYARPVEVIRDLGELGLIGEWGPDYEGNMGWCIEAYAGDGMGTQVILAENFVTYQNPSGHPSPPFAEYTSGHSSFSAAGAQILELFTGSQDFGASVDIDFLLFESDAPVGTVTLDWATFDDAAADAGISRIYGGIHFPDGDMNGRWLGTEVGQNVWEEAVRYFDGTADEFAFV